MASGAPSSTQTPEQMQQQIQRAVAKAVSDVEARQAVANKQLVAGFERRIEETVKYVQWMEGEAEATRKRKQVQRLMAINQPADGGDAK